MSWTFCLSGAAVIKAGANCSTTIQANETELNNFSDQAEATINGIGRKDMIANYSLIGTNFKHILDDLASDMIAMKLINYDMSNFTSRLEAQTMLDVLRDNILRNMDTIKDDKNRELMGL